MASKSAAESASRRVPRSAQAASKSARKPCSPVKSNAPFGTLPSSASATSRSVGPITSRWSARALVITPCVERTIISSERAWRRGWSAMHSITSASAPSRAATPMMRRCSMMFACPARWIGYSVPSGMIIRGREPVALAQTRTPCARSAPAIRRTTEDLPRVPFTWMRIGIAARLRRWSAYSATPRPAISAMHKARKTGSDTRAKSLARHREAQDALEQAGVGDAGGPRGAREVLARGDVRGRVRLDQLRRAVRRQPQVDPRVAGEAERPVGGQREPRHLRPYARREARGTGADAGAAAVGVVELGAHGRDAGAPGREAPERELADGERARALVPDHADGELAAVDVFLGEGVAADASVHEGDALAQAPRVPYPRGLRDPERGLLVAGLDDQRIAQPREALRRAPAREDGEGGRREAAAEPDRLRQRLVAREQDPARIGPRHRDPEQLEEGDHVGLEAPLVAVLHQQVEDGVGA